MEIVYHKNSRDERQLVVGEFYTGKMPPKNIIFKYSGSLEGNNPHTNCYGDYIESGSCADGLDVRKATWGEICILKALMGEQIHSYEIY